MKAVQVSRRGWEAAPSLVWGGFDDEAPNSGVLLRLDCWTMGIIPQEDYYDFSLRFVRRTAAQEKK